MIGVGLVATRTAPLRGGRRRSSASNPSAPRAPARSAGKRHGARRGGRCGPPAVPRRTGAFTVRAGALMTRPADAGLSSQTGPCPAARALRGAPTTARNSTAGARCRAGRGAGDGAGFLRGCRGAGTETRELATRTRATVARPAGGAPRATGGAFGAGRRARMRRPEGRSLPSPSPPASAAGGAGCSATGAGAWSATTGLSPVGVEVG
jgi:hypothetical protein